MISLDDLRDTLENIRTRIDTLQHQHHEVTVSLDGINGQLEDIRTLLHKVLQKENKIMALVDDLKAAIKTLDDETNQIAATITALVAKLNNASITDAEKADVLAAFGALSDRLTVLGKDPTVPVPPPAPQLAATKKKAGVP